MSVLLEKMIDIAERNGSSSQRPWELLIFRNGKKITNIHLSHYDTPILVIDMESKRITDAYGQSKSDADAIRQILNHYDISYQKVSYRPSIGEFVVETSYNTWTYQNLY